MSSGEEAVRSCLAGGISPQVAVSRMLLAGLDAAGIVAAVADGRAATPAWEALADTVRGRDAELDRLAGEIRRTGSDHTALGGVAGIAAFFDGAVRHSPEAGVALYSLGDPAILDAATAEIVDWLRREGLVRPGAAVLDVGCGIGRVAAALAAHGAEVVGTDVSAGMVAEARRRHAGRAGLRFEVTDGRAMPAGPFALVLLVDSMPYVHQAGLAAATVADAAARLLPGGALVVLNLSYGRDHATDRAEAAMWTGVYGWSLQVTTPFRLWDATAFVFR